MIKSAYVKINVMCTMDDKTAIPTHITMTCGEPDADNCIEYACGCFVNEKQLQDIFDVFMQTQKNVYSRKTMRKILQSKERQKNVNRVCKKCRLSFLNDGPCRYRLKTEGCKGFELLLTKEQK